MMPEWEDDQIELLEIEDFEESADDPLDGWEEMVESLFAADKDELQPEWPMISALENHDIPRVVELVENADLAEDGWTLPCGMHEGCNPCRVCGAACLSPGRGVCGNKFDGCGLAVAKEQSGG